MNSTLEVSGECGHQVLTKIVESVLEFPEGGVEGDHRVQTSVGLVGKHVRIVDRLKRDGIVKVRVSSSALTHLMERLFEVHNVVDIG